MTADVSALLWTTLAAIVFLLGSGVVYSYYVLARWIDDDDSYASVRGKEIRIRPGRSCW